MKRRICVSTGKRGGFGALVPVMRRIDTSSDLQLQVVVTDMHLNQTFGYTAEEVAKYVRIAEQVPMDQAGDSADERTQALGRCLTGMAGALSRLAPDMVLLLGDRSETLVTAFAAIELGIPVAHIQAGDRSGGLDDIHRAAITKLCHLHMAQTQRQADRVLSLGEEPWRVHVTGAPYIDRIACREFSSSHDIAQKYDLRTTDPIILVLQHSDTYAPARAYADMRETLRAVSDSNAQVIVCYPCSDQGYAGILRAIDEFGARPQFRVEKNIDAPDFLGLMSVATAMVGNSSAAVIEAPYFNLPAVNVGDRQRARERGPNVIDARPSSDDIAAALRQAVDPAFRLWLEGQPRLFGDGKTSERIVEILRSVELGNRLFQKQTTAF